MSESIQTKRCSKCKHFKPLFEFHKSKKVKNGHRSRCKQCRQKYRQDKPRPEYMKQYKSTLPGYLKIMWLAMLRRCNDPKRHNYHRYGGRGIKVEFASFEYFFNYVVKELKADPRGLTIDRINNDGNYERGNIRFVSNQENSRNRRIKKAPKRGVQR